MSKLEIKTVNDIFGNKSYVEGSYIHNAIKVTFYQQGYKKGHLTLLRIDLFKNSKSYQVTLSGPFMDKRGPYTERGIAMKCRQFIQQHHP